MAKHAAPRDHSFLISVGKHLGAAVGLVAVVAAAFWGIGQIRTDETDGTGPVIADSPAADDTTDGGVEDPADGPSADPDVDPSDDPTATSDPGSESPTAEPEPSSEPSSEPGPTQEPEAEPSPEQTTDDGRIAPSSISVQVLDAVLNDGSAAADDVERRLEADGYRVVANNRASKTYEVTTVFYTAGFEAEAQQVAADHGWTRVEPKPDNLSDTVQVHVVVGADEA